MLVTRPARRRALFGRFIDDALSTNGKRHTIDIRPLGTRPPRLRAVGACPT
jgi:hypothetical protein